ncbi:alcohol oxidase [Panus rudis PR-1116 ss-1]|nr:alcohol oxidase [Panus rudis PR-1116 ss-1]
MWRIIATLFTAVATASAIEVDAETFARTAFDYIVVGGGTTGVGVAARLSDQSDIVVGIIEAGPYLKDDNILIPDGPIPDPKYDWLLSSTPQKELNNRSIPFGRGKALGGTSIMNSMGYTRTQELTHGPAIRLGWGQLGNSGWNFDDLYTYMKKSENWTAPSTEAVDIYGANNDPADHGIGGSLQTTSHFYYSNLVPSFLTTIASLGVPRNHAALGGNNIGTASVAVTVDAHNRSRSFSANGYYDSRATRQNLVVLTGAQATHIEFADSSPGALRATKVHFVTDSNVTSSASVSRDIVLSAGAIKTPQLLELSGIGNATFLQGLGIKPVIDLPGVGEHFQDHFGLAPTFLSVPNATTWDELNDPEIEPALFQQYVANRSGLLSSAPCTAVYLPLESFMPAELVQQYKEDLDAAMEADPATYNTSVFKLQRSWLEDPTIPQGEFVFWPVNLNKAASVAEPKKRFYSFLILIQHPWARGSVHITSNDPLAAPLVDPNYLNSPSDWGAKILLQAVKYALNISQTEPLRSVTTDVLSPQLNSTDNELLDYISSQTTSNYHLAGSAAMLPKEEGGVVGPDLLVYGTSNVRVADSSIFPIHISAHPQATLYGYVLIHHGKTKVTG